MPRSLKTLQTKLARLVDQCGSQSSAVAVLRTDIRFIQLNRVTLWNWLNASKATRRRLNSMSHAILALSVRRIRKKIRIPEREMIQEALKELSAARRRLKVVLVALS